MNILVAGGAGYIGSHTCLVLLEAGHQVIVADNLVNSKIESLQRVERLTGKNIKFYLADVTDEQAMAEIFSTNKIDGIIHFAGLKAVGESVEQPLRYYHNNVVSTMVLAKMMERYEVKKFVFSSSATVYGDNEIPFVETMQLLPTTNPYGQTKVMSEQILTAFGDCLRNALNNATFDEPATTTVRVELTDGLWAQNPEDFAKLEQLLFDRDAVEGL